MVIIRLDTKDSADWQTAADIFDDRIKGRFLKQVQVLGIAIDTCLEHSRSAK